MPALRGSVPLSTGSRLLRGVFVLGWPQPVALFSFGGSSGSGLHLQPRECASESRSFAWREEQQPEVRRGARIGALRAECEALRRPPSSERTQRDHVGPSPLSSRRRSTSRSSTPPGPTCDSVGAARRSSRTNPDGLGAQLRRRDRLARPLRRQLELRLPVALRHQEGRVRWAESWSREKIEANRGRDRRTKEVYYGAAEDRAGHREKLAAPQRDNPPASCGARSRGSASA
jgi:hypothetical protein